MAQAFNLTAQLQLQGPRNANQVINDIRRQLKPVGVKVNIQNTRNLARANRDLQSFNRAARDSRKNVDSLNRTLQESARRFSVITLATGSFLALANSFKNSVKEAIAFERELVRISQVTGKSVRELKSLSDEVTRLSTSLGASSKDLLNVARTLSQAGFAAEDTKRALDILAKTSLGATFDSIQDTTEGAIALLRQFSTEARSAGGDIAFLEKSLDAINSVSKRFAVESGDLITVIRRTGGVFSAAGGSVNELIALFTSVRATTRESAETIATGLRTIFTRLQRTETVQQLKALNIELQDSQGQFVGAFEAVKRLSIGLSALNPRDYRFSQIVEELGGFRQIGKVIPLIQQFATAQEALNVAQGASGSVSKDAETAQQSLGVQIDKVRQQFDALLRKFQDSSSFKSIAGFALKLAEAFIKVADALEPVLPLLTSLAFLKLGSGLAPAVAGLAGIGRRAGGGTGPVSRFARGGIVPGIGNRDTVPAMLTPGEFVIRKSSVKSLGVGTLAAMNENRYASGGIASLGNKPARTRFAKGKTPVGMTEDKYTMPETRDVAVEISRQSYQQLRGKGRGWEEWLAAKSRLIKDRPKGLPAGRLKLNRQSGYPVDFDSDSGRIYDAKDLREGYYNNIDKAKKSLNYAFIKALGSEWDWSGPPKKSAIQYGGQAFGTSNKRLSENVDEIKLKPLTFLYPKIVDKKGKRLNTEEEQKKRNAKDRASRLAQSAKPMATGGGVSGSDTIPAMLTPGEFVFNKSAAQSIGYSNLSKMNKHGVQGYARGGIVGLNSGGSVQKGRSLGLSTSATIPSFGGILNDLNKVEKALKRVGVGGEELRVAMDAVEKDLKDGTSQAESFGKAFDTFKNNAAQAQKELEKSRANPRSGDTLVRDSGYTTEKDASGNKSVVGGRDLGGGLTPTSFAEAAKKDASIAKSLEQQQKKEISAIAREIRASDANVTAKDALIRAENVVRNEYGVLGKEIKNQFTFKAKLNKAYQQASNSLREFSQKIKNSKVGQLGGYLGGKAAQTGLGSSAGRQGFANQANAMAGAAQSAIFLGASVAAVATQMSGLSEVTKQAVSETAGFATGIVGIGGTLAQIFTSMMVAGGQQVSVKQLEAAASLESATADEIEAAASAKAAAAGAAFAVSAGLVVAAVAAAVIALKYSAAQSKAQADAIGKERKARLDAIKETGTRNIGALELQKGLEEELALRQDAAIKSSNAAYGTVAAYAAIGATIGSVIPGIGTAVGFAIGGIAGATAGYISVTNGATKAVDAATREREKEAASIRQVYEANIALSQASYQLNSALASIESAPGLEGTEKTKRRLEAQQIGAGLAPSLVGGVREKTAADAQALGITQAQLKALTPDEVRSKGAELGLEDTKIEAIAARSKVAFDTLEEAAKIASTRVQETGKTLQGAINSLEFGDSRSAIESQKLFAQANQAARNAILEEQAVKLAGITDEEARKAIIKEGNARLKNFDDGIKAVIAAKKAEEEATKRAVAAQIATAEALRQMDTFLNKINNIELNLDKQAAALDNFAAVIDNATLKIKASGVDEIGNISAVKDLNKFSQQISSITSGFGPQAQKVGTEVAQTAGVLNNARKLIGRNFSVGEPIDANQLLKNLGLTPQLLGPGGQEVFNQIAASLKDAKGTITEDALAEIFAPLEKIGTKRAEVIQRLIGVEQKSIDNYQKFLDVKEKLRSQEVEQKQREIDAIKNSADLRAKADQLIAKTTGREQNPADVARSTRQRNQQARRVRNQAQLSGIRVNGQQLDAGNAGNVAAVRQQAIKERKQIQQQAASGNVSKALIQRQQQLKVVIDSTTKVLEDFADQGDAANDIFAEMEANISLIEKERNARQQMLGVIEEFVVGGEDARKNLIQASQGIRLAFATGTLQNQTPEQRQATVSLLDKLSDIELAPGFTGKQIKQELVLRDAIRMGLDPEIAKQLATATSTEEKLINANKLLAEEINKLTAATVESTKALDPQALSSGGMVQYRAAGGTIFKPRGTDTVPAMLTPGEFVIRKSAVDKIGVGNLQALNNGGGTVPGFANGGPVYLHQGGLGKYYHTHGSNRRGASLDVGKLTNSNMVRASKEEAVEYHRQWEAKNGDVRTIGGTRRPILKRKRGAAYRGGFGYSGSALITPSITEPSVEPPKETREEFMARTVAENKAFRAKQEMDAILDSQKGVTPDTYTAKLQGRTLGAKRKSGTVYRGGFGYSGSALITPAPAAKPTPDTYRGGQFDNIVDAIGRKPTSGSRGGVGSISSIIFGGLPFEQEDLEELKRLMLEADDAIAASRASLNSEFQKRIDAKDALYKNFPDRSLEIQFGSDVINPIPERDSPTKEYSFNDSFFEAFDPLLGKIYNPNNMSISEDILGKFDSNNSKREAPLETLRVPDPKVSPADLPVSLGDQLDVSNPELMKNIGSRILSDARDAQFMKRYKEYEADVIARANDRENNPNFPLRGGLKPQTVTSVNPTSGEITQVSTAPKIPGPASFAEQYGDYDGDFSSDLRGFTSDPRKPQDINLKAKANVPFDTWFSGDGNYSQLAQYQRIEDIGPNARVVLLRDDGKEVSVPGTSLSQDSMDLARKYYRVLGYAKGGRVQYKYGGGFINPFNTFGAMMGRANAGMRFMMGRAAMGMPSVGLMSGPAAMRSMGIGPMSAAGLGFMSGPAAMQSMGIGPMSLADFGVTGMRHNALMDPYYGGAQTTRTAAMGNYRSFETKKLVRELTGKKRALSGEQLVKRGIVSKDEIQQLFRAMLANNGRINKAVLNKAFSRSIRSGTYKSSDYDLSPWENKIQKSDDKFRKSQEKAQEQEQRDVISRIADFMEQGYTARQIKNRFPFVDNDMLRAAVHIKNKREREAAKNFGFAAGGSVPYFANGGSAGGDSVPAMLTPGEFVMSADSVKKHGVGFMESLNRGNVPGFNKGGMVQYRQEGGMMGTLGGLAQSIGIDTSKIEGVFGGFVDNFSAVFDNILLPFNGIMQGLNNIADKFGNFVMSHKVEDINVNLPDLAKLDGMIASSVKKAIEEALPKTDNDKKRFRSNQ